MQFLRIVSHLCVAGLAGLLVVGSGCTTQNLQPPIAKVVPQQMEKHGYVWTDNYHWLWNRKDPEVSEYLEAENTYAAAVMSHTRKLQDELFEEFKGRIRQTDNSVPCKEGGYFYYSRMEEGKDYPIYCRKKETLIAPEQIILDVNQLALGHQYCAARPLVSPDGNLMAYMVDTAGRRFFTFRFTDLQTGKPLPDVIPEVTMNMQWANDNKTIFYAKQHPGTLRSCQVYRHVLGTDPARDELVYEEKDEEYSCYITKTKSKKYLMVFSSTMTTREYRYLDADAPLGDFKLFLERQKEHEYYLQHYKDHFYILTNFGAKNFRVVKTPVAHTEMGAWEEVIPHRNDTLLERIDIFKDHLVVLERNDGLLKLRIMPWSGQGEHYLDFGEPAYSAWTRDNYEFETPVLRYGYSSLTTPTSLYDYNMITREKKLLKRDEVLGGFSSSSYETERLHAPAPDGVQVPVTLVFRKGFPKNGSNPLLLDGYGAYGASEDPYFDPFLISLLDRGFVYAIAHVRGGSELGRDWYDQGRLLNKKNTFTDFIACAEYLLREKYAAPDKLFAEGASAGGLLMGAVANMRPDLFKGILAMVPWVEALTESIGEGVPVDKTESQEWGDFSEKKCFDYVRLYSPYHNLRAQKYPNILATTSLEDSQVQYWNPAKWVAKLRATKTDKNWLLLKTEMEGGHGGASGRFERYRNTAFQYAFLLNLAGIQK